MKLSPQYERKTTKKVTLPPPVAHNFQTSRKHTIVNDTNQIQLLRQFKKSSTNHRNSIKALRRISTSAAHLKINSQPNPINLFSIRTIDHSDTIPSWLSAREDFQQNCIRIQQSVVSDLFKVAKSHWTQRSDDETEALYMWVRQTEFFKALPQGVIRELCNVITAEHYFPYTKSKSYLVIEKGTAGECLYIVYRGKVIILLEGEQKAHVDPGGYFGELALDRDQIRTADAIAETDTYLFVIKDSDYKRIVFSLKNLEKSLNLKLLINISLFQGISYAKLQTILNSCAIAVFSPGDKIFDIDSNSTSFYIIQNGLIELQIIIEIEKTNKWPVGPKSWNIRQIKKKYAVKLKECKGSQYFGEFEIIKNCNRKMRAIAKETCKCLVLNSEELLSHYFIKDQKKLDEIVDEYEYSITLAESEFRKNLQKKVENEQVLKTIIENESKRSMKLKEAFKERKKTEDELLRKQLIENSKKEKTRGLEIDEENPIFKTVGPDFKNSSWYLKRHSKVDKGFSESARMKSPFL